jgi:hypothetical protein
VAKPARYYLPLDFRLLLLRWPFALYPKDSCVFSSHGLHKQTSIKKQISDLATRFSDKQATVARGAMGGAIPASVIRFMISADRIIGANTKTLQRTAKDRSKPGRRRDQPPERALGPRTGGVNQYTASVELVSFTTARQSVNPLFQ